MPISPLARQFLVAGSTHLAALSVGGVVGYPSVLFQQFQANDTIVQLDLHKTSWIGSVHGIAGIPSILLPLLMQYKGRKFAFVISCISIVIGWGFSYFAHNITFLIIGECFHGFGGNSLLAVSFLSISEIVQSKYRNTCCLVYATLQAFGMALVGVLGRYIHWKTVSLIMSCPMMLAIPMGLAWPDSPSWLAYKGKYEKCERTFKRLRGTDEESKKELKALLDSQKVIPRRIHQNTRLKYFSDTIGRKDFYMPAFHTLVLLNVLYWSGGMPVLIYSADLIVKLTGKPNKSLKLIMDCVFFVGFNLTTILVRFYSTKKVMLCSMSGSTVFMSSTAIVTYLQSIGYVSKDSELAVYVLIGFIVFLSLGTCSMGFNIASEIMPVKHRGLGGCLYIICTCVFHSLSLKAYPYLSVYIEMWGVFLIYTMYLLFSILFIWKYVPDTKNRTLQEIEEFYNLGFFKNSINNANSIPFIRSEKH